ncbi:hypothetical protein AB8A21_24145 [Streptomyces sp. BF23-18]
MGAAADVPRLWTCRNSPAWYEGGSVRPDQAAATGTASAPSGE